jgi:hypothetical protein
MKKDQKTKRKEEVLAEKHDNHQAARSLHKK